MVVKAITNNEAISFYFYRRKLKVASYYNQHHGGNTQLYWEHKVTGVKCGLTVRLLQACKLQT